MTTGSARILILCTRDWFGSARLPAALARAGFEVASLAFPDALIGHSRHVSTQFPLPPAGSDAQQLAALERALRRYAPELVIPGDDPAVELMHAFYAQLRGRSDSGAELASCIEQSLGAPEHYGKVQSRRALHTLAITLGLRVPQQAVVANVEQARVFAEQHGFPVILKAENSCAGYGTSICRDREALVSGFAYFDARYGARNLPNSVIAVQRFITGRTAMRAVSACAGDVLAGLSAYKLETHPAPTGPSTVVEFFEHADMAAMVARVARAFSLSGFASFDFMIESETGAAYLIELNPRPTPICHLGGAFGDDLCGALWQRLTGCAPRASLPRADGQRVVLFPQEWVRGCNSSYFQQASSLVRDSEASSLVRDFEASFHDVPWDEPSLLQKLTSMGLEQMGWTHLRREETRRESLRELAAR